MLGTYLINGLRIKTEFPQGLKPGYLGLQMSELKLRPPRTIYEIAMASRRRGKIAEWEGHESSEADRARSDHRERESQL
jgi:hypothetical protein